MTGKVSPPIGVDDQKFFADLAKEDPLGIVVRGVIYIEHEIIALIEESIYDPKPLKELDLDFHGRVTLAMALGLDPRFAPPLRALGSIRNKFAHQPNVAIGKNEVDNLYRALDPDHKVIVQGSFKRVREISQSEKFAASFKALDPLDELRLIIVTMRQAIRAGRIQVAKSNNRRSP